MLKEFVKNYFKFLAMSYMVYGISDSMVRFSRARINAVTTEDFSETEFDFVLISAFKNFKEFGKNMKKYLDEI